MVAATEMFRKEGMLMQRGASNMIVNRLPMARSMREGTRTPANYKRFQVMALDQTNPVTFATYEDACYELACREGMARRRAA